MQRLFIILLVLIAALSPTWNLVHAQDQTDSEATVSSGQEKKKKAPEAEAARGDKTEEKVHDMEDVVVTATRTETLKEEVPSVVDVITSEEIKNTVADDLPDILKKNSSVDVIDYPGVLAGISIRGFRPEYSGITKHYLVLIDGRPAGATNLATILKDNVERIEVLKGPASSLYGAEAMGGVVNVITKKSTGKIKTNIEVGGGSFGTNMESISSGGKIDKWLDFDASFSNKIQAHDFRMGNGENRANTSYEERHGAVRVGSSFLDNWRVDAKTDWFMGRDIGSPNALYYGDTRPSTKDVDRYGGDVTLTGEWGRNFTRATFFASHEQSEYTYRYTGEPTYKGYLGEYDWLGAQIQDTIKLWDRHDLTLGFDYQNIDVETHKWDSDGSATAPYSPNNSRESIGLFADGFLRFWNDRIIVNPSLRYDRFDIVTKETPLKTDFIPGTADFDHLSPRMGVKYFLTENRMLQLHATIGTAFVPPEATQMAGYSETVVQGVTMITKGNPDLKPETSLTWDGGITFEKTNYGLRADFTYFNTTVEDKISTAALSSTVTSYTNADSAEMNGFEFELSWDLGAAMKWNRKVEFFANATWFLKAEEKVSGVVRDIYNVSHEKYTGGINYDDGTLFGRFLARYMGERKDNDWYTPGYPEITYDPFVVCDLVVGVRFLKHHTLTLNLDNIFDEYYYEKPEYPLPGRAVYAKYTLNF